METEKKAENEMNLNSLREVDEFVGNPVGVTEAKEVRDNNSNEGNDGEGEEDSDEDEYDEDDEEEEEEADEDFVPLKRAPTKRTTNTQSGTGKKRAKTGEQKTFRRSFRKPPRPKLVKKTDDTTDFGNLFEVLKKKGGHVESVASVWTETYLKNSEKSLIGLLNFLFQSCGSSFTMDGKGLVHIDDVDEVVENMVETAQQGSADDTISGKTKEFKQYRNNLTRFWNSVVLECRDSIIFDDVLVHSLSSYVIALACTPMRLFRLISTITALQMVSSFVVVANLLVEQRETLQRQINVETKKKSSGPRIKSLSKSQTELSEKIASVEGMMRNLFTGVFMHRYRDVDPEIRLSCISSLGSWINEYPSLFLQDLYLKYVGWTLNDKVTSVRRASVTSLLTLYSNEEFIPSLSLFSERFLPRILEMANDIDVTVAVSSIHLVKLMAENDLVEGEDLDGLYDLVFDESSQVRKSIGKVIFSNKIAHSEKSNGDTDSELVLRSFLPLLSEYSNSKLNCTFMIDALCDHEAFQDWGCMIKLLLDENESNGISSEDALNLIRTMNISIKNAMGEKVISSDEPRKSHVSKSAKDSYMASQKSFTSALIKWMPKLLRKFLADPSHTANLVEIVIFMDIELFSTMHQESNFASMAGLLKEAFFKHADEAVLENCAKSLQFYSLTANGGLKEESHASLSDIEKTVVSKFLEPSGSNPEMESQSEDDFSQVACLQRAFHFQKVQKLESEDFYFAIVRNLEESAVLSDEVVRLSLLNLFLFVSWRFAGIKLDSVEEETVDNLHLKLGNFSAHLESSMDDVLESFSTDRPSTKLASQVLSLLSDTWCLFNAVKLNGTKARKLSVVPRQATVKKLWSLCEELLKLEDDAEGETESDKLADSNGSQTQPTKEFALISAAKLVANKVIPAEMLAPEIISHFVSHGKGIAEVVKMFCQKLKAKEFQADLPVIYFEALKRAYIRHQSEADMEDTERATALPSFLSCKELAAKLSSSFVSFGHKVDHVAAMKVAAEGLKFAFEDFPDKLSFLECSVAPFGLKLGPEDLRKLIKDAQSAVAGIDLNENPTSYKPLVSVMEQMKEKLHKLDPTAAAEEGVTTPAVKRGRPKKPSTKYSGRKRLSFGDSATETSSEPDADAGEEPESAENDDLGDGENDDEIESDESPVAVKMEKVAAKPRKRPLSVTPTRTYSRQKRGVVPESPAAEPSREGTPSDDGNDAGVDAEVGGEIGSEELNITSAEMATEEQLPKRPRRGKYTQFQ